MSGGDCPPAYSRRQDRPENLLCAGEVRAFSRDNELCGLNSHCFCQSTKKESKGNERKRSERKGNIYLEIIDGINNELIKNVYINLEVPELGFEGNSFHGTFSLDGARPLAHYTLKCSADGYASALDGYGDGRGIAQVAADEHGNWHGRIALMPYSEGRRIRFSDLMWHVRDSLGRAEGPDNNYWSKSIRNVWVDERGRLHLKITRDEGAGKWYCPEVVAVNPLGYGDYTFYVAGRLRDILIKNEVLGLFNYLDASHEIDIEYGNGAWSEGKGFFGQFATQPAGICERHEFPLDRIADGMDETASNFSWQKGAVRFSSSYYDAINADGWTGHKCVPEEDVDEDGSPDLQTHINLWLYGRKRKIKEEPTDIIINKFIYSSGRKPIQSNVQVIL